MNGSVLTFAVMILCGGAVSLLFDLLRAVRIGFKPGFAVVLITDVIFCAAAVLMAAGCVWNFNNGEFRLYEVLGLVLGGIFYFLLLSRWILKFFLIITENILKFIRFISKILLTQQRFLYKILIVPVSKYRRILGQRSHSAHDRQIQKQGD